MAITYTKFFQPVQLTTALVTIYTIPAQPANGLLRGGRIRLVNTSATAVSVEIDVVPAGSSAGVANQLVPTNKSVPANDWVDVDLPIMAAGDSIQGKAGTAGVVTVHSMSGGVFS